MLGLVFVPDLHSDTLKVVLLLGGPACNSVCPPLGVMCLARSHRCALRLANLCGCELLLLLGLVGPLLPPLEAMLQRLEHPLLRHRDVRGRDLLRGLQLSEMLREDVMPVLAQLLQVSLHLRAVPGELHPKCIASHALLIVSLLSLGGLDAIARNKLSDLLLGSLLRLLPGSLIRLVGSLLRDLGFRLQHLLQTWVPPLGLRVRLLVLVPDLHSDPLKVVLLLGGPLSNMLSDDLGSVCLVRSMRCTLRLANLCFCELLLPLGLASTLLPPLEAMFHRLQHLASRLRHVGRDDLL